VSRRNSRRAFVLAAGLGAVPALALGLGRFGYALILPAMRNDLHWSYLQASVLTAANALGYLLGALFAARAAARSSAVATITTGSSTCAASIALCALTAALPALTILRFVAGASGGLAFVAAAGLAADLGERHGVPARRIFGTFAGGAGVGIVLALCATPSSQIGWRASWLVLGGLGLAAIGVMTLTLRNLGPAGSIAPAATLPATARRELRTLAWGYGLFGAAYIGYMTFIVALLRAERHSDGTILVFWGLLGSAAACSTPFWTWLPVPRGPHAGPAIVIAACGLGALLPAALDGTVAALTSAIVFGGSFFAVVAAVSASARTLVATEAATAAIGLLTVSFAIGQSTGPLLGGALADTAAGLRVSLALAALVLFATAAGLAAADRSPHARRRCARR
jgi:predicted MFS family arabinose efflux permease